jgi:hypothetical protein
MKTSIAGDHHTLSASGASAVKEKGRHSDGAKRRPGACKSPRLRFTPSPRLFLSPKSVAAQS